MTQTNNEANTPAKLPVDDPDVFTKYPFLASNTLSDDLKKFLVEKSIDAGNARWTRQFDEKKWRWGTPLAIALTGLITLAGNFIFDFARGNADAGRKATASMQEFQFRIVERELSQQDKSEAERARVLLFLLRAGILNNLSKEELTKMATVSLRGASPDQIGIPSLGPRTPISSPESTILETTSDLRTTAPCLSTSGFKYVARYYRPSTSPFPSLTREEALALSTSGQKIVAISEGRSNSVSYFSKSNGTDIAKNVFAYARDKIQQPGGSTIFFAVDFNPTDQEISENITPFFLAVNEVNKSQLDAARRYRVGVYGSGLVIQRLRSAKLAEVAWLAGAPAWAGSSQLRNDGSWDLLQTSFAVPNQCGVSWGSTTVFKPNSPDTAFAFALPTP